MHSIKDGSEALLGSVHEVYDFLDKDRRMGTDYMRTQNPVRITLYYYFNKTMLHFHVLAFGCILVPGKAYENIILTIFFYGFLLL